MCEPISGCASSRSRWVGAVQDSLGAPVRRCQYQVASHQRHQQRRPGQPRPPARPCDRAAPPRRRGQQRRPIGACPSGPPTLGRAPLFVDQARRARCARRPDDRGCAGRSRIWCALHRRANAVRQLGGTCSVQARIPQDAQGRWSGRATPHPCSTLLFGKRFIRHLAK